MARTTCQHIDTRSARGPLNLVRSQESGARSNKYQDENNIQTNRAWAIQQPPVDAAVSIFRYIVIHTRTNPLRTWPTAITHTPRCHPLAEREREGLPHTHQHTAQTSTLGLPLLARREGERANLLHLGGT